MSEDDILNDFSKYQFKGVEEYGLYIIGNQLDSLVGFNDLARLIESDEYWKSTVRLIRVGYKLISGENAELREKAFNLFKKNKNYVKIFDLYIWLLIDYKSLDFTKTKPDPPNLYCYNRMTQNERKIYMLCWINGLVNWLMSISDEITEFAIQRGLIERLLTVLDDHDFLDKIQTHLKQSLGSFISSISCLSANPEQHKQLWLNAKAIEILEKILEKDKFSKFSISIFCTILTIASDNDLETLIQKNEYIERIVKLIVDGANEDEKSYRFVEVYDSIINKTHKFEHMQIHDTDTNDLHTLRSIIELLYRMAVNSKAKEILYKKNSLTQAVKNIFKEGNEHEKSTALDYFAQLCFDNNIRKDIAQDVELIVTVKEIIGSSSNVKYKPLIKSCEQFIWLLEEEQPEAAKAESKQKQENAQDGHIMISYNKFNRDLCLKIKYELEDVGLKVWMDLRDLHGSTLEEMARAVETAECVLICVTENYRQSINCQAEAKHAFKFEKKIIPLIMQEGYVKVGGWLGFIISDRMCIDFSKYKFEECIKKLKEEIFMCRSKEKTSTNQLIERLQSTKQQVTAQRNDSLISSFVTRNDAKEWENSRVKDWFIEMNLVTVYEVLKPLNGSTLYEIYKLKISTPELFSQLLSHSFKNNNCINLIQAVHFGSCLENLFAIRN